MRIFICIVLILAVGVVILLATSPGEEHSSGEWKEAFQKLDYKQALVKAEEENKVIMMDFTTDWCGACRMLENDTFSKEKVKTFLKNKVVAIQVDADKSPALTSKYNVTGFPTMVFVNSTGDEVGRIKGYRDAGTFLDEASAYSMRTGL